MLWDVMCGGGKWEWVLGGAKVRVCFFVGMMMGLGLLCRKRDENSS